MDCQPWPHVFTSFHTKTSSQGKELAISYTPLSDSRLEAIAPSLEAIASGLEAITTRSKDATKEPAIPCQPLFTLVDPGES